MWVLDVSDGQKVSVQEDDITFVAVLKRGETVHNFKEGTYVRNYHLGDQLMFRSSLLEATSIEFKYPEYVQEGLMGKWKIVRPTEGNVPNIVLIEEYQDVHKFLKDAKHLDNAEWIRNTYLKLSVS